MIRFLNANCPICSANIIAREYSSGPVAHPASQTLIRLLPIAEGITCVMASSKICKSLKKKVKAMSVQRCLRQLYACYHFGRIHDERDRAVAQYGGPRYGVHIFIELSQVFDDRLMFPYDIVHHETNPL